MKKTKEQLKNLFANGCIPNGNSFADLIDSMSSDEDLAALLAKVNQRVADSDTKNRQLLLDFGTKFKQALADSDSKLSKQISALDASDGNLTKQISALTQQFSAAEAQLAQLATQLATLAQSVSVLENKDEQGPFSMPADGQWHALQGVGSGNAFHIVAFASDASSNIAVTRADLFRLTNVGKVSYTVQQPLLEFWRRISLQWDKQAFQMRTMHQYKSSNGSAPVIQYMVTRL